MVPDRRVLVLHVVLLFISYLMQLCLFRNCKNYASSKWSGIFLGLRAPEKFTFSVIAEELAGASGATSGVTDFSIGIAAEFLSALTTGAGNMLYSLVFKMKHG